MMNFRSIFLILVSTIFATAPSKACWVPSINYDSPVFDVYHSAELDKATESIKIDKTKMTLVAFMSGLHDVGSGPRLLYNFEGVRRKIDAPHFGLLTFDRNDYGKPAEFRIVAKSEGQWRTLLFLSINPAQEEIMTGDHFDRRDQDNNSGFLMIAVTKQYHPWKQEEIFQRLNLEERFPHSKQKRPNRQADTYVERAPLWIWSKGKFQLIPAANREKFEKLQYANGNWSMCTMIP